MTTERQHRDPRGDGAPPAWIKGGRIPSLDGVRAIAILLVLYAHASIPGHTQRIVSAIKGRSGFLGVQLFFVLSGFLITTLLLREIARTGRVSRSGFYVRRALRILPVYLLYLAVVAVLPWSENTRMNGFDWLTALTYTVNFHPAPIPLAISHVWSLSIEEHFYLLWPLIMAGCTLAGSRRAVLGCIVCCLSFRCVGLLLFPSAGGVLDLWTFGRMDDVAFGCLLALLAGDPLWRQRLDRIAASLPALAVIVAALLVSQVLGTRLVGLRLFSPASFALVGGLSNTVNACGIAMLLWTVMTRSQGVVGRILNSWPLSSIGTISYSLYLWHVLFCDSQRGALSAFPLNIVCMFAVATLSYHLIEKRFLALKDRLSAVQPASAFNTSLMPRTAPSSQAGTAQTGSLWLRSVTRVLRADVSQGQLDASRLEPAEPLCALRETINGCDC
jgi:peptidoglycan/LPS O-acetylase OafA/YrhL